MIRKLPLPVFFVILFLGCSAASFAQTRLLVQLDPNGKACTDSITRQWVLLKQNAKGAFQQQASVSNKMCNHGFNVTPGTYKVSVFAEGYYSLDSVIKTTDQPGELVLSGLNLQNKLNTMQEAVVRSPIQKMVSFQNDKMIVDVKNNALLNTASTYEALEKIPGVLVDANNKITLNGKGGVSIWMDGQPTNLGAEDLNNLLRSLPADAVEKIEVISNPGAAYDAQGSGGIINILTFKSKIRGMNGSLNNNVSRGAYWRYSTNLRLNTKYKGLNTQLIAGYTRWKSENETALGRMILSSGDYFRQLTTRINDRKTPYMRFTGDYDFTRKLNVGIRFNLSGSDAVTPFDNRNFINNLGTPLLQSAASNTGEIRQKDYGAFVNYKFNSEGKRLTVVTDITDYKNQSLSPVTETTPSGVQYSNTRQNLKQKIYSAKADFMHPLPKAKAEYTTGAKYTHTDMLNAGQYLLNSPVKPTGTPAYNRFTNYKFDESIFALYGSFSKTMGKLNMGAGLRMEHTNTISRVPGVATYYDTTYTSLFPNFNLNYKLSSLIKINASYARRINRPGYGELDPNFDYTDSLSLERGNPNIFPTFSNSVETRISIFDYAQVSFSYSYEKNPSYLVLQTSGNQSVQTNVNLKYARNYSVNTFIPVPLDFFFNAKKFKENMSSGNLGKMNVLGFFTNMMYNKTDQMELFVAKNKPLWVYGAFLQVYLPADISLQSNFWKQAAGVTQLYSIQSQYSWDMTASKQFFNKKLRINLAVNDILKSRKVNVDARFPGVSGNYYNVFDSRVFRIGISYSFGKFSQLNKREVSGANDEEKQRVGQKKGFSN
jgi:iron complex outermembrane recepter protein